MDQKKHTPKYKAEFRERGVRLYREQRPYPANAHVFDHSPAQGVVLSSVMEASCMVIAKAPIVR